MTLTMNEQTKDHTFKHVSTEIDKNHTFSLLTLAKVSVYWKLLDESLLLC